MAITASVPTYGSSSGESDLSLKCSDLMKEVSFYLGWGRSVPTEATKLAACQAVMKTGARMAYYPQDHEWSWLRKEVTIRTQATGTTASVTSGTLVTTSAATFEPGMVGGSITFPSGNAYTISSVTSSTVASVSSSLAVADTTGQTITVSGYGLLDLPDDFASLLEKDLEFDEDTTYPPVEMKTEGWWIRESTNTWSSSRPAYAVLVPIAHGGTGPAGQRWQLKLCPTPDADYGLIIRYRATPNIVRYLAGTGGYDEYPDGGPAHAEMIKEAMLAAAETAMNDELAIHRTLFNELLAASIHRDRAMRMPDVFGYNGDGRSGFDWSDRHGGSSTLRFNGVTI